MDTTEIDEDFTGYELDLPCEEPNLIRLKDVLEYIESANTEEVRRIIKFSESFSGLCSNKEEAERRGIKPSSFCTNNKYEKFKFVGKTFAVKG